MRELFVQPVEGPRPNKVFADQTQTGGLGIELYVASQGITYSDTTISGHYAERGTFKDPPAVEQPWLPHETEAVLDECLDGQGVVRMVGDLGSGKSTVFFGLRSRLREAQVPYVYLDGHFTNNSTQMVTAVRRATRLGGVVLFDSFDHLFMNDRSNSRLGVRRPRESRATLLPALQEHVAAGGRLIFSNHTAPWFARQSTPEHRAELDAFAISVGAHEHNVNGLMRSLDELAELCTRIGGRAYAHAYVERAVDSGIPTAMSYRVLKRMLASAGIERVRAMGLDEFADMVRVIDDETRSKMGAPEGYSFVAN